MVPLPFRQVKKKERSSYDPPKNFLCTSHNPSHHAISSRDNFSWWKSSAPCMPLLPSPTSLPPPHLPMLTFAPVISPWLAAISCVLITMLLIGSFFLFPLPKEASEGSKQRLDRDHPLVIHRRFKGIFLTSTLVPIYLWWILNWSGALPSTLVNDRSCIETTFMDVDPFLEC